MSKSKFAFRYLLLLAGLFTSGAGIALSIKIGIGSTPMSIFPLVLSKILPITFGQMNFLMSLVFVLVQILILGKEFSKEQYLQILACVFFGYFVDLGMMIFQDYNPVSYPEQLAALLAGCLILAFGIYLQILARVIINPGEGVVRAIAYKTRFKFGNVKVFFDIGFILLGVGASFLVFGKVQGIREGTFLIALLTGSFTKLYKRLFDRIGMEWLYE